MLKPEIIKMEDNSIYISIRNYMEYSIDDSIEYKNITIDVHNSGDGVLLVGVQINPDEKDKEFIENLSKLIYFSDNTMCCLKFNTNNKACEWVTNYITSPNVEIYVNLDEELIGIIVRRIAEVDIIEQMKTCKING